MHCIFFYYLVKCISIRKLYVFIYFIIFILKIPDFKLSGDPPGFLPLNPQHSAQNTASIKGSKIFYEWINESLRFRQPHLHLKLTWKSNFYIAPFSHAETQNFSLLYEALFIYYIPNRSQIFCVIFTVKVFCFQY